MTDGIHELAFENAVQFRCYGLTVNQIIFLAQYYESMTGKDPRKVMFPC